MLQLDIPENIANLQLPDPYLVNYYNLAQDRIFYINEEIDENVLEIQKNIIHINILDKGIEKDKRKPIVICINTCGGLLQETMSLAQTIILSKTPVYTVNIGAAYSGGALLLLSGHKRYALKYSKAMIHSGSGGMQGTYEQTEAAQKLYKKQIDKMGSYILERSGMDKKVFTKNKSKDWYLDHDEQLQYGLVHEIIDDLDVLLK